MRLTKGFMAMFAPAESRPSPATLHLDHLELTNHRHQVVDGLDPLGSCEQVHDQIAQVAAVVPSHLRKKTMNKDKEKKEKDN